MQIRKAQRRQSKLRLALCGVSGSGKTMSAIKVASGIGGKFVFIDTESGSADLYCHLDDYDVLPISPPFSTEKYIKAINLCEDEGYDTIIIDSLSHAWNGQGGILQQKEQSTKKNDYAAWGEVTPKHNNLMSSILLSKCHMICCMRSKASYQLVQNSNGKMSPVKIGMEPVQRPDTEHEFTVAFDLDRETHKYNVLKDRTELFEGSNEIVDESIGKKLFTWLNEGISRVDLIDKYKDRLNLCESLGCLRDVWADVCQDNLLSNEIEELTKLKDDNKSRLTEIEFKDDIKM